MKNRSRSVQAAARFWAWVLAFGTFDFWPPTRRGPGGSTLLETRGGGYALVAGPEQIDAHRFEAATRTFTPVTALATEAKRLRRLGAVV